MANMKKEDVLHLAKLARIKLSDKEVIRFAGEIESVINYVSQINEIVADKNLTKKVGPVYNVFREDKVTNLPGTFSEVLKSSMPDRDGDYLKVKKILNSDN